MADRDVGVQARAGADARVRPDHAAGADDDVVVQRDPGLDHRLGADGDVVAEADVIGDHRRGVSAGGRAPDQGVEEARQLGIAEVGIVQLQARHRAGLAVGGRQQHRGGAGGGQVLEVGAVGEEGHLVRRGVTQRGQAAHPPLAVALEAGSQALGDLGQCEGSGVLIHGDSLSW